MVDWRALLRGLAIDAGCFAVLLLGDSWGKSTRTECEHSDKNSWRILGESCEATRIRLIDQLEHIARLNQSLAVCEWKVAQCEKSANPLELHLLSVVVGFLLGFLSLLAAKHRFLAAGTVSVTQGQPVSLEQALVLSREARKPADSPETEESNGDSSEEVARAREHARALQG